MKEIKGNLWSCLLHMQLIHLYVYSHYMSTINTNTTLTIKCGARIISTLVHVMYHNADSSNLQWFCDNYVNLLKFDLLRTVTHCKNSTEGHYRSLTEIWWMKSRKFLHTNNCMLQCETVWSTIADLQRCLHGYKWSLVFSTWSSFFLMFRWCLRLAAVANVCTVYGL